MQAADPRERVLDAVALRHALVVDTPFLARVERRRAAEAAAWHRCLVCGCGTPRDYHIHAPFSAVSANYICLKLLIRVEMREVVPRSFPIPALGL